MKTVGASLSPTGIQEVQPKQKKFTVNKEDQPRDGRTTSTVTNSQRAPTETTTKEDAVESDVRNSRLRQPARPTSQISTTTTTQPTTHDQATSTTEAHGQNEYDTQDDEQDDDDTPLILSQLIGS